MSGINGSYRRVSRRSGAPRRRPVAARAWREPLVLLLFSAAACTAAGEFEPAVVGVDSAAGAAGREAAPPGPGPLPSNSPASPVLGPGEADAPVSFLPNDPSDDPSDDNAGATRSDAEDTSVILDAGLDAGDGGGEGTLDAGRSPSDAGAPDGPDASAGSGTLDASTPPPSITPPPVTPPPVTPQPGEPCPGLVFEGTCYEFFDEPLAWNDAESSCIAWGGHLASVESSEEDAFIGAWPALLGVPLLDGSGLWLGGSDARAEGDFRWWDARPLSFAGWASDQPNNGAGVDCIEKRNDATQRWYDRRCNDGERYVCERPE